MMQDLQKIYSNRFNHSDLKKKEKIWKILCSHFFQKWISGNSTVLEIATGNGEFIKNIRAYKKIAVDLNPDAKSHLPEQIEFIQTTAQKLTPVFSDKVDVVFCSNFFEHLNNKDEMTNVLKEAFRVIKPGGFFLSLQPNIKFVKEAYWDFYDHQLPLTHLSAKEAFESVGYHVELLIPKFLPYSTKSRLPQANWIIFLYLKIPLLWKIFGKQFFLVARKPK